MGNLHPSEGVHLRFLDKCPELPPAPAEHQAQLGFDELLLSLCADPELREELNATESIETKWAYTFLSKLPHDRIAEEWLDPHECVDLVQRFRSDTKCIHDLFLAIRINVMLRPIAWVEKFVSERGIEELLAPLQAPGGASSETCNEVLNTLFVFTNSSCGLSAILGSPDCCTQLHSIFDLSPSNLTKARSLKLLRILCRESPMAQDAIMGAFSSKTPEERTLQTLVIKVEENQADIALQLAAVKFVNTLLEATRDRKQRVSICDELKSNGLLTLLEPFRCRDDHTDADSSVTAMMIDQVKVLFEYCNEATNEDNFGAFRLALGDVLGTNRSNSGQIGVLPDLTTGNQRENDEADQIGKRTQDKLEEIDTGTHTKTLEKEESTISFGEVKKETSDGDSGGITSATLAQSENLSLDKIFSDLQQHTNNMNQETSDKLTKLLEKLALTLSDQTGASQAVDRLEKSLSLSQNPEQTESPGGLDHVQEAKPDQEPDLLTRVGLALFPSLVDQSASVTKPPLSGRPPLFSGFGDFSLASLTATTPAKSSISRPSFTSFIGADSAASPWGRSTDSTGARGVMLSLPFFQSSRKGPGLGVTPACTPIASASVRKDAKRPVFPSFPSPPKKEVQTIVHPPPQSLTSVQPTAASSPDPSPTLPHIDITLAIATREVVKPLVLEQDEIKDSSTVKPPATGTDISKFRKLLSMGAPREAVRAKMQQVGLNPDLLDEQQGFSPKASPRPALLVEKTAFGVTKEAGAPLEAVKAQMRKKGLDLNLLNQKLEVVQPIQTAPLQPVTPSGSDISKFKKLLSMGAPLGAVKAKMIQAGLDPALLDSSSPPSSSASTIPSAKTKVKDDHSYAKFFKLLSMGAPAPAVKAKMLQAGLTSELLDTPDADMPTSTSPSDSTPAAQEVTMNPRLLLSGMLASREAPQPDPQVKVKDDPQYAKFFKLLLMGAPAESVKSKMRMAGLQPELLDTPDAVLKPTSSGNDPASSQTGTKVKDDPAYAKFFKLLSMGAPAESVKAKMRMAGLQPDLLDTPDAMVPIVNNDPPIAAKATVTVKDDPSYAKFFKLLCMGAPAESVKTKMQMAGLKPELLDTPNADVPNGDAPPPQGQVKVKDDPSYAKFFKLLEMGAPSESVKAKMRMAGLQADLLDTPDASLPSSAPVKQPAAPAPNPNAARRAHLSIAIKPAVKTKTRAFYWQQLKAEAIQGTVWEELEKEHSNQSNQDLLTLTDKELELLETEFPPPAACGPSTGTRRGNIMDSPAGPLSPLASPRVVFLIDRGRSNNVSIIVKQFRMSNAALRVAIMKMDSEVLTLDRVQGLIKILPTEEEIAAITGFRGDPTTLNGAELVLKELITVPRLKQRLSALETKHQFPALVRDLQTKINKIRVASKEIAQSSEFKTILLVILQVGNKMNDGTPRGGAKGFRLNDLTKLVQLKSAERSVTLLHYVARMIRMKKGNVVRLGDSLASLYDVQSIPIPELQGDMNRINDLTENINVELAAQRLKNRIEEKEESDLFVESMTVFVDDATKEVTTLKEELDETLRLMRDVMLRFDKNTYEDGAPPPSADAPLTPAALTGAGEFFSIIYEFTMSLTKADRENELKRIRDEKRLKQQELKSATPRRNPINRAASSKFSGKTTGPETQETPLTKSMIAVPTEGVSSLLSGVPNNPAADDTAMKAEPEPANASSSEIFSKSDPETSKLIEPIPTAVPKLPQDGQGVEEKGVPKPSGIPRPGLKLPGQIIKESSQSSSASPLKKFAGATPTSIPSPMKLQRTNTSVSSTEKTETTVSFDAASVKEIKLQLETKHTANNGPPVLRVLKPEVEADSDHDNNNSEPSSPEKALSEAEPTTRVAIQL